MHYQRRRKYGDFDLRRKKFKQGGVLTVQILQEMLHYNEDTGVFTRKIPVPGQSAGSIAGTTNVDGYISIGVNGREYLAHRLAIFYKTGRWPEHVVDHKNLPRSDNRWENIRPASSSQNNHRRRAKNATGFRGVSFIRKTGRYRAKIRVGGENVHLGVFSEPGLAHQAYVDAANKYYGEFATPESSAPP